MSGSPAFMPGKEPFSALDCHPACPGVPCNRSAPGFPTSLHYPKLRMRLSVKPHKLRQRHQGGQEIRGSVVEEPAVSFLSIQLTAPNKSDHPPLVIPSVP